MPELPIGGSAPNAEGSSWMGFGAATAKEERGLAPIGSSMGSSGTAALVTTSPRRGLARRAIRGADRAADGR